MNSFFPLNSFIRGTKAIKLLQYKVVMFSLIYWKPGANRRHHSLVPQAVKNTGSSSLFDFSLGIFTEKSSLDDDGLFGQDSLFQVPWSIHVEQHQQLEPFLSCLLTTSSWSSLRSKDHRVLYIDGRTEVTQGVLLDMEVPHSNLSKVSRMVFVEVDSMMMHSSCITSSSGMLSMLPDSSMTMRDMPSKLSSLLVSGCL